MSRVLEIKGLFGELRGILKILTLCELEAFSLGDIQTTVLGITLVLLGEIESIHVFAPEGQREEPVGGASQVFVLIREVLITKNAGEVDHGKGEGGACTDQEEEDSRYGEAADVLDDFTRGSNLHPVVIPVLRSICKDEGTKHSDQSSNEVESGSRVSSASDDEENEGKDTRILVHHRVPHRALFMACHHHRDDNEHGGRKVIRILGFVGGREDAKTVMPPIKLKEDFIKTNEETIEAKPNMSSIT